MKHHLNHIILHDGKAYHLFERLGKNVPFEAYNPQNSIFSSENLEEVLENPREVSSKSWGSPNQILGKSFGNPRNFSKGKLKSLGIRVVNRWDIEEKPYEVVFNE